jgi:hypothetical protein
LLLGDRVDKNKVSSIVAQLHDLGDLLLNLELDTQTIIYFIPIVFKIHLDVIHVISAISFKLLRSDRKKPYDLKRM